MTLLGLQDLLRLHALMINSTGGSLGVRDVGRLEAAIATQTQNVFGEELYPDLNDKAAAMIRGIMMDHPFIDGNKRTAMIAGLTILEMNGIKFKFQSGEIEKFALIIATKKYGISEISTWLSDHITKF